MFTCPGCSCAEFNVVQLQRHEHKLKNIDEPDGLQPTDAHYVTGCQAVITGESTFTDSEWFLECCECGERIYDVGIVDDVGIT